MSKEQQREEQLSALLDSELDAQQLDNFMQDLKRDPIEDTESAQRYRLIGDVMRDELDPSSFVDISDAVHRAIEQEPAYNDSEVSASKKRSHSLSRRLSDWSQAFMGLLKGPLAGMTVAASVAMVTLVTFNTVQNSDETQGQSAQLAQASPVVPMNAEIARNVRVASTLKASPISPQQQQQLKRYMLQHSGYASQSTMQGMMPYVRAADVNSQKALSK